MPTNTCPDTQDDGILVVPTVADTPIKLKSKKAMLSEFHDRAFPLLSIATMSGCCQVYLYESNFYLILVLLLHPALLYCHTNHLQVTVPFGKHEDCPVGVSFIAFHGSDKFLLDTILDMYQSLQAQVSAVTSLPP